MAEKGIIFGETAAKQIVKTVREVARRTVNEMPQRGRWQQHHGGGGGGNTIWFTIDSVLCPDTDYVAETTLVVTATWYAAGCNKTPPGANDDGTYNVYDLCSYLNGLTVADLLNGIGRATYHYPLSGTCTPRWIIDDLCPAPECQ